MHRLRLLFLLLVVSVTNSVLASEKTELAQAIKQLEAVEKSLLRAKQQAKEDLTERFIFDYLKAKQDIELVKMGINRYLNISRAQPRNPTQLKELSGDYDKERK